MTQDFKNNLAAYLTNKLVATSPTPKTEFDEKDILDRTAWDTLLPSNYEEIYFNGDIIDNISNKIIVYGYYKINGNSKGIIVILDETFTPIKVFTSFNNGTELNPIQCMKQIEDGTYYYIDKTTRLRFVMVNNFSSQNLNGEYILNFRTSYNFDNSFDNYTVQEMFKSGTSAKYVFFTSSGSTMQIIELEANVGEPIVWSTPIILTDTYFGGAFALFNDDGVFWRMMVTRDALYNLATYTKNYTETTATLRGVAIIMAQELKINKNSCTFLDQNTVYYTYKGQTHICFQKYDFSNEVATTIYEKNLSNVSYDEQIGLSVYNGDIYIQYITNIINSNGHYGDYYFQRLINDVWDPVLYETNKLFEVSYSLFIAKADFNLVQLYSLSFRKILGVRLNTFFLLLKDNYNALNYNGNPYTNYNSMLPKQAEIYSENSLVFARNIIDKTVIDNKTVSTITIPNTYLNNINLDTENLLSETNTLMTSQNVPITKNIYETIYLNFVNSITSTAWYTGHTPPTQKVNLQIDSNVNSYINQNLNVGTEANSKNTSLGWLIVNYADGTTLTSPISWTKDNSSPGYSYSFVFALDVQKEIVSYEVKSFNQEQTYYIALNNTYPTYLEVGNVYKITQRISVI